MTPLHSLTKHLLQIWIQALFPAKCIQCRRFFKPLESPPSGQDQSLLPIPERPAPTSGGCDPQKSLMSAGASVTDLARLYKRQLAPFLCLTCIRDFTPITSPLCLSCGTPFKNGLQPDHHCGICLQNPPPFAKARSAAAYSGSLQACLHAFKYGGRVQLAQPLGSLLLAVYLHTSLHTDNRGDDVVIPVPLGTKRLRSRGFNQAYLLVHRWQQIGRREAIQVPEALADGLKKVRRTRPQTGLDRKMRLKNVRKAFQVNKKIKLEGRTVLLVDDVYTTGATLTACTNALLAGGAERVNVLTLARRIL